MLLYLLHEGSKTFARTRTGEGLELGEPVEFGPFCTTTGLIRISPMSEVEVEPTQVRPLDYGGFLSFQRPTAAIDKRRIYRSTVPNKRRPNSTRTHRPEVNPGLQDSFFS